MGRVKSGKPANDMETAAESCIFIEMTGNLLSKKNKNSVRMTVTEQLRSSCQIDDFNEKKQ
ncbi:MAG: hypothetical protein ACOX4M_08480 [Acetivibrionales bacterium]